MYQDSKNEIKKNYFWPAILVLNDRVLNDSDLVWNQESTCDLCITSLINYKYFDFI